MRALLLMLVFWITWQVVPAHAETWKEAKATPVTYSRNLPKVVSGLMPSGSRSLYWGNFTPQAIKTEMAIHLIWLKPSNIDSGAHLGLPCRHNLLHLFKKSKHRWEYITNIPLDYTTSIDREDNLTFKARFYWVDAKRTIPLLCIDAFDKFGAYGPTGNNVFVSFVKGWHSPPAIQTFLFGGWFASDSSGEENSLQSDEAGNVRILTKIFSASDGSAGELYFPWSAQHQRFWPDDATEKHFHPPYGPLDAYISL